MTLGARSEIVSGARIIAKNATVSIADDVYVGRNATMIALADLRLGGRTLMGENVSIHTEDPGPAGARDQYDIAPIDIGEDVWIGAGAVVLKGVTIGRGSTIGANAVVTRDVPENVLAAGVPATVIRTL